MTPSPFSVKPMLRLAQPADVGRALRLVGRMGADSGLSEERLGDLADIVRAMTIGLALDRDGGWLGVRRLSAKPGLEVVAFDGTHSEDDVAAPGGRWAERLRADLDRLGDLGLSVMSGATAAGGTAVWARIVEIPPVAAVTQAAVDVSGLLQAPADDGPGAGWSTQPAGTRLGIVVAEDRLDPLTLAARDTVGPSTLEDYRAALGWGPTVGAALVEIDLARRVLSAAWSGGVVLSATADSSSTTHASGGTTADGPVRELTLRWERSLSLTVHTRGIRPAPELAPSLDRHPALTCATLMRDHREPTPVACVVSARVRPAPIAGR
ncbi:hypothetical protein [Nocardioides montaniterrae]